MIKTTFYDDVGECYEFSLLLDDVWKKDEIFLNFSVRVLRMIALEVDVPVENIGYGKWGGRITWGMEDSNESLEEWVNKIEKHPTFLLLKKVCEISTRRIDGSEEQENIFSFLDMIPVLEVKNDEDIIPWAKKDLTKEEYKKFMIGVGEDGI